MPRMEVLSDDVTLYLGDCREILPTLEAASIDAVVADLPYGTTQCEWDSALPFDFLWREYYRVGKRRSSIILIASQPFTSALVMSNPRDFKVEWIWQKNRGSNFATTKFSPMKEHESVLVFQRESGSYNPIRQKRSATSHAAVGSRIRASNTGKREGIGGLLAKDDTILSELRVPSSVQRFNVEVGLHEAQKPLLLFEYFIETYSESRSKILDNTMGSGTSGVASVRLGRSYTGIEKDPKYFDLACRRVSDALSQPSLFVQTDVEVAE